MDFIVRVICVGFFMIAAVVLVGNVRLLLESKGKKKDDADLGIKIERPKVLAINLLKASSFFLMINHGLDLCEMREKIETIPYYRGKRYTMFLGESDEKN